MPQVLSQNPSQIQADSIPTDSVLPQVAEYPVILPVKLRINQDSLWQIQCDSILHSRFPEPGKISDYAVGLGIDEKLPDYVKGEFYANELKVQSTSTVKLNRQSGDFVTVIIFLLLFVFGILSMVYRKRVQILFNAFLLRRYANQIQREENALSQRVSVLLSITFLLSASLLFHRVLRTPPASAFVQDRLPSFGILLGLVTLFFLGKILFHRIAAFLLRIEKEINDYLFNFFLIHQVGGLALFFIALISGYTRGLPSVWIAYATGGTFLLMFVYQTIRGVGSVRIDGLGTFFYIFLYFCTLEILPLVLLFKIISV